MQTLLATSPLTVYFWAPTSFSKYSSGVYSCSRAATVSDLNHGVQVIGYDSSGNYIIKNSWGTGWGYGGFGYVNGNQNKDCGIHMIVLSYQGATLGYSNASTCSTPASGDKLVISCILMIILMIIWVVNFASNINILMDQSCYASIFWLTASIILSNPSFLCL